MNKDFMRYLLERPHSYITVWSFMFANSNEDGVFLDNYQNLLSRFKLSRSSLQRIVEYGCMFTTIGGQKMGRKWAGKTLEVIFFTEISGQNLGRIWADNSHTDSLKIAQARHFQKEEKPNESKEKKKPNARKESNGLYKEMVAAYDDFCHEKIGMGAKMDALQGKSMKLIISYLQSQIAKKQGDLPESELNNETLNAWKFILSKWSMIGDFYGQQIKLNQINSNLPNILTQIRTSNKKQRNEKFASTVNEIDGISFGETEQ